MNPDVLLVEEISSLALCFKKQQDAQQEALVVTADVGAKFGSAQEKYVTFIGASLRHSDAYFLGSRNCENISDRKKQN